MNPVNKMLTKTALVSRKLLAVVDAYLAEPAEKSCKGKGKQSRPKKALAKNALQLDTGCPEIR